MKPLLPIGIQNFREIREKGYLYVDKTQDIAQLLAEGKYYFLSRPRRFGKSLTLSVIKEIFLGSKDLFEGLWIADKWDWSQIHPVIHVSFSSIGYHTSLLEEALYNMLVKEAVRHNIQLTATGYDQQFKELLEKLCALKGQVVILIDEYDKPLIDYLDNMPKAKAHQKILKTFYSIIKDCDPYIQFLLITGVSKFSKVSVFSELNNLDDITIDWRFASMLGWTQEEVESYFSVWLTDIERRLDMDRERLIDKIRQWYNGYSWDGKTKLYNPFSILSFVQKMDFQNYWFSTGTPTFLIKMLRNRRQIELENVEVDKSIFESYSLENLDTLSLLFQTGYNTIKSVDEFGLYTLDYPNKEVRESMLRHLIGEFRHDSPALATSIVVRLRKAFLLNDLEQVIAIINSLFKSIPSHIFIKEKEAYYHSLVYLVFQYLGQFIEAEVHTSDGRIDALVETDNRLYILEFKLDKSAEEALRQIHEKNYIARYRSRGKPITAIGVNFSSESKSVEDWKAEEG